MSPSTLYEPVSGHGLDGRGPGGGGLAREQCSEWREVPVSGERAFDFTTKGKRRHDVSIYTLEPEVLATT